MGYQLRVWEDDDGKKFEVAIHLKPSNRNTDDKPVELAGLLADRWVLPHKSKHVQDHSLAWFGPEVKEVSWRGKLTYGEGVVLYVTADRMIVDEDVERYTTQGQWALDGCLMEAYRIRDIVRCLRQVGLLSL